MLMPTPARPAAQTVPAPLTAEQAAELFCVIAKHERLRIIGLALATRSVTVDELEAIGVGDHDALMAHLRELASLNIIELRDDNGTQRVQVRSPFTKVFFDATRDLMADLRGGPLVMQ